MKKNEYGIWTMVTGAVREGKAWTLGLGAKLINENDQQWDVSQLLFDDEK